MSKRSGSEKRQRMHVVAVRLNEAELLRVDQAAKLRGVSRAATLRWFIPLMPERLLPGPTSTATPYHPRDPA